jgi:hypothetical protein
MSISVEAAEARDSLSDDKEIVNSYEVTIVLDFVFVCVCVFVSLVFMITVNKIQKLQCILNLIFWVFILNL